MEGKGREGNFFFVFKQYVGIFSFTKPANDISGKLISLKKLLRLSNYVHYDEQVKKSLGRY